MTIYPIKSESESPITIKHKKSMGEIHIGDKIVRFEDHTLEKYATHLHHGMTDQERKDLFHEARFGSDRAAFFQPHPGVHLVLRHDPSGHYTLEKNKIAEIPLAFRSIRAKALEKNF